MSEASPFDRERELEANRLIIASLMADRRSLLAENISRRALAVIPHGARQVSFHLDDDAMVLDDVLGANVERIDEVVFELADGLIRLRPDKVFSGWDIHYDAAGRFILGIPDAAAST